MSDIFCYFLGAGASFHALPLVESIPDKLDAYVDKLTSSGVPCEKLVKAANWLQVEVKKHASIDTFAKKLFLKGAFPKLKKLKAITSCFFVYEQARHPVDYRYDSFLASILNGIPGEPIELPNNIRFLSWNYDTQLEKAFYGFCNNEDHVINQITFGANIKRLNGYCGTLSPGHVGPAFKASMNGNERDGLEASVQLFNEYSARQVSADINFAWELQPKILFKKISDFLSEATIVILIGYSFPFFNREIDQEILKRMSSVRKLYVQVPEKDHPAIEERMSALCPNFPARTYLKDMSQFYIPFDYK